MKNSLSSKGNSLYQKAKYGHGEIIICLSRFTTVIELTNRKKDLAMESIWILNWKIENLLPLHGKNEFRNPFQVVIYKYGSFPKKHRIVNDKISQSW